MPSFTMLFIIFLDPQMLQLEESARRYDIDKKKPTPRGAYANDMVLHTNTKRDIQKLLNKCVKYFDFIGLKISTDGRNKSIYTSNIGKPITRDEKLQ